MFCLGASTHPCDEVRVVGEGEGEGEGEEEGKGGV